MPQGTLHVLPIMKGTRKSRAPSALSASLSLSGLPCSQLAQVFIFRRGTVMYFFGSFSVPIKKVTEGDQENHPMKPHKSHFRRKTGERWPPRALLCAVVIPATA